VLGRLLGARLETLRGPPLPGPAQYASELSAVAQAWNELAAVREGLPKIV
jgi:hypothetical protein